MTVRSLDLQQPSHCCCVGILLSQAWELQSETLLCLSCESYIFLFVTRMQTNSSLWKLMSEVFIPSIHPSIHGDQKWLDTLTQFGKD